MSKISRIKGFADIFAPGSSLFTFMENTARRVFSSYGYSELRVPILEFTELFSRGIGTETDVVQKEMFTFPDRKGRSLTMRPECTAGIMRAYIDANLHARESVSKLFSFGPMFRYERPQKGRMRQFHQLDCECLGAHEPQADAECVAMLMHLMSELGLDQVHLELNTLGCKECRPRYKALLTEFLRGLDVDSFCEDCQRRIVTNPLRVLDCKAPRCKDMTESAPSIGDHVCPECAEHFAVVTGFLSDRGIPFVLNSRLVRGLDYYMRTTFEVVSTTIGAQGSVAGGGRYDGLVAQLGGPDVPGVGYAVGMERVALMLEQNMPDECTARPDFYLAVLEDGALNTALCLAQALREEGFSGETSFAAKSMKSQMRQASKTNARYCLILGKDELAQGTVNVKNMDSGEQRQTPLADAALALA